MRHAAWSILLYGLGVIVVRRARTGVRVGEDRKLGRPGLVYPGVARALPVNHVSDAHGVRTRWCPVCGVKTPLVSKTVLIAGWSPPIEDVLPQRDRGARNVHVFRDVDEDSGLLAEDETPRYVDERVVISVLILASHVVKVAEHLVPPRSCANGCSVVTCLANVVWSHFQAAQIVVLDYPPSGDEFRPEITLRDLAVAVAVGRHKDTGQLRIQLTRDLLVRNEADRHMPSILLASRCGVPGGVGRRIKAATESL